MKTVISADELAKDVTGAEALLERHQEHKVGDKGLSKDIESSALLEKHQEHKVEV